MMSAKILVYIDQVKGKALPASWEVFGAAHALAAKLDADVAAVVLGADAKPVAEHAFHFGASAAYYCDDPSLADYRPEPYADVLVKVARDLDAAVLLFPTTTRGREQAAMSSIDLGSGVIPDVTALDEIARQGRLKPNDIVALTAFAMKGDAERFLSEGFDGFIAKPVRIAEIVSFLEGV